MKRRHHRHWLVLALLMLSQAAHADAPKLSPQRLDLLDRRGYFTPAFKQAVRDMVNAKQAVVEAKAEQQKLNGELPDLQRQVAESDGKVQGLQKQLSDLDHIDESDFAELQKTMGQANNGEELQKQLADAVHITEGEFTDLKKRINEADALLNTQKSEAQAYIWAYPMSPHQAEAQKDLQEVQKKIAAHAQAQVDAESARSAAHAKLVQRAQARDLSIAEWRDFLLNMSKEEIVKFLGVTQSGTSDEWVYAGAYTEDAGTHQKVGLVINFNGGRVVNVSQAAH